MEEKLSIEDVTDNDVYEMAAWHLRMTHGSGSVREIAEQITADYVGVGLNDYREHRKG